MAVSEFSRLRMRSTLRTALAAANSAIEGKVAATFPSIALFAAANAVRNVLRILKAENSLTATFDHLLPLDDYYELVGLKAMLTREESYDKAAEALTQKRAAE